MNIQKPTKCLRCNGTSFTEFGEEKGNIFTHYYCNFCLDEIVIPNPEARINPDD